MKVLELKHYESYRLHKTRRKKYHDLCYEQYKLFETVLGCTNRLKQLWT
ncbi:hypothetical protein FOC04_00030 [Bacillus anthracis]|nr:hypothetical protein FOC04_00030 [Bacillus anthracis]